MDFKFDVHVSRAVWTRSLKNFSKGGVCKNSLGGDMHSHERLLVFCGLCCILFCIIFVLFRHSFFAIYQHVAELAVDRALWRGMTRSAVHLPGACCC